MANAAEIPFPLDDRILVRRDKPEVAREVGGLTVATGSGKEPPDHGVVLFVGTLANTMAAAFPNGDSSSCAPYVLTMVDPGDVVYFSKYAGIGIKIPNEEGIEQDIVIMRRHEIYAINKAE